MRIVAGQFRGRNLVAPPGSATRPTGDRTRQALFNILEHGGLAAEGSPIAGSVVLDAFAGTGALGLEALSRGASRAFFFEQVPAALACLRQNIQALGQGEQCAVFAGDVLRPPRPPGPCTLVFLDPPYHQGLVPAALDQLTRNGWIDTGALVVAEIGAEEGLTPTQEFTILDKRLYGASQLLFLRAPSYFRINP